MRVAHTEAQPDPAVSSVVIDRMFATMAADMRAVAASLAVAGRYLALGLAAATSILVWETP